MRRKTLLIALLGAGAGAAALATAGTPAVGASKTRCENRKGVTLLADRGLRIYTTTTQSKTDGDAHKLVLRSCRPGGRKVRRLDTFNNNLDGTVRLREAQREGRYILIHYGFESGVNEGEGVLLYDNRNPGNRIFDAGIDEGRDVLDWELSPAGGVVVQLGEENDAGTNFPSTLLASDSKGPRTLDAGTGITDVALAGATVYWKRNGTVKTAVLDGRAQRD